MLGIWIVIAVVVMVVLLLIAVYNGLVQKRVRCQSAWSQIDVQLKRRYDLIPNLVETVKGYMSHERETLDAVITARNQAAAGLKAAAADPTSAAAMKQLGGAESALTGAMGKLSVVFEAYPDLKANTNVLQLQEELVL